MSLTKRGVNQMPAAVANLDEA